MQGCRLKELLITSIIANLIAVVIMTFYRFARNSGVRMMGNFNTEITNTFVIAIARGKRDIRP